MYSVQSLAQTRPEVDTFITDAAILENDDLIQDPVYPHGFIFHVSRCGSTLISKALAREQTHLVINQGGPLQRGFWGDVTADWTKPLVPSEKNLARFRRLVLAMTRRRIGDEKLAFVKFISRNTLCIDFIRSAFPDVPCLFMYRDPVEVIASIRKETTAPLVAKGTGLAEVLTGLPRETIDKLGDTPYLAHCFAQYFHAALKTRPPIALIDYRAFNMSTFPLVLQKAFDYEPSKQVLSLMTEQFAFHSKDDGDQKAFTGDSAEKQKSISGEDRALIEQITRRPYEKLKDAAGNLALPVIA